MAQDKRRSAGGEAASRDYHICRAARGLRLPGPGGVQLRGQKGKERVGEVAGLQPRAAHTHTPIPGKGLGLTEAGRVPPTAGPLLGMPCGAGDSPLLAAEPEANMGS